MSEAKAVGNIGTAYEDRRNGKCGVLMSRDEEAKTLTFFGNGEEFTITYGAFKSNWRKVATANDAPVSNEDDPAEKPESVPTPAPQPQPEPEEPKVDVNADTDAAAEMFSKLAEEAGRELVSEVIDGATVLTLDGVKIMESVPKGDGFKLRMLPDLFTFSNFAGLLVLNSIEFTLKVEDHLCVSAVTKPVTMGAVYTAIAEAAVELNLYGYQPDTAENEESEETVNE